MLHPISAALIRSLAGCLGDRINAFLSATGYDHCGPLLRWPAKLLRAIIKPAAAQNIG